MLLLVKSLSFQYPRQKIVKLQGCALAVLAGP